MISPTNASRSPRPTSFNIAFCSCLSWDLRLHTMSISFSHQERRFHSRNPRSSRMPALTYIAFVMHVKIGLETHRRGMEVHMVRARRLQGYVQILIGNGWWHYLDRAACSLDNPRTRIVRPRCSASVTILTPRF